MRWLKIEQRLVDLDIAVKTSLHLERPAPDDCINALDELNELALAPLMLKKQPDIVTTIRLRQNADKLLLNNHNNLKSILDDYGSTLDLRTIATGRTKQRGRKWRRIF